MKFTPTRLGGAYLVDLEHREDNRGLFARAFCVHEFRQHGLEPAVAQANYTRSHRGAMRGMHYQIPPAVEAKFIRCVRGSIYDVIVDLRPDSPTFKMSFGIELNETNRTALYVPEMFAHGYLALTDDAEVFYQVSEFYTPDCERGFCWNDPAFAIEWPFTPTLVSEKDANWPPFRVETI